MDFTCQTNDNLCAIAMQGSFTFNDNIKFREIIRTVDNSKPAGVELNLAGVDFIDSAALGMLLLLRDNCVGRQIGITLKAAKGQVEKMLLLSRFDQLFGIKT